MRSALREILPHRDVFIVVLDDARSTESLISLRTIIDLKSIIVD